MICLKDARIALKCLKRVPKRFKIIKLDYIYCINQKCYNNFKIQFKQSMVLEIYKASQRSKGQK